MRQAAQCMGRALRGKSDYGLMVFADKASSYLFNFKPKFFQVEKLFIKPSQIGSSVNEECFSSSSIFNNLLKGIHKIII